MSKSTDPLRALEAVSELQDLLRLADLAIARAKTGIAGEPLSYAENMSGTIRRLRQESDALAAFVERQTLEQRFSPNT